MLFIREGNGYAPLFMILGAFLISMVASLDAPFPVEDWVSTPPTWLAGASLLWEDERLVVRLRKGCELDSEEYDHALATLLSTSESKHRYPRDIEFRTSENEVILPAMLGPDQIEDLRQAWLSNHSSTKSTSLPGRGALAGKRIVLSAGHGINWYEDEERWRYQRGEQHSLREDIHCNQIVAHHLAPMLEAAGADVVLLRERSSYTSRVVVDNDPLGTTEGAYGELGGWQDGASAGRGGSYRVAPVEVGGEARATWTFAVTQARSLPVYTWYKAGSNRSGSARYEIDHAGGTAIVSVNQKLDSERWRYLGTFPFAPGMPAAVHLTNDGMASGEFVVADSIRLGGGTGFVDYGAGPSGQPRWRQSAKSHAVEEEIPLSVRSGRGDVGVRPSIALWQGADIYFALHTNAGGGRGTSSFVYSNAVAYPSFDPSRATEVPAGTLALQDAVHESMINTLRASWKSDWIDRGKWGADFGELRPIAQAWQADRSVEIPAMLVEVAFHDSADDTVYLREERFRHDVARSIVDGMIAFVHRDAPELVVAPPRRPVGLMLTDHPEGLRATWKPAPSSDDSQADVEYYEVELSTDGFTFGPARQVFEPQLILSPLLNCETLAVRVRAINAGGSSLASTVAIARPRAGGKRVLWVDGVRRVVQTVLEGPEPPRFATWMLDDLRSLPRTDLHILSTDARRVADGSIDLADFDLVIWSAGETSTRDGALLEEEMEALEAFLAQGGFLLLSGAEIGWDLVGHGDSAQARFYNEVLGAEYLADAGDGSALTSADGILLDALPDLAIDDGTKGRFRVEYPDVMSEGQGAHAELLYADGGVAALSLLGTGGVFLAGFPLEAAWPKEGRRALLSSVLSGFLGPEQAEPEVCGSAYPELPGEEGVHGGPARIGEGKPMVRVVVGHGESLSGEAQMPKDDHLEHGGGCGCGASGGAPLWLGALGLAMYGRIRRKA